MENITAIRTRDITMTALLVALLSISGYISFPIPFTPIMITAQTIIINLIALILMPRNAIIAIIAFLMIGAIGIPVFAGGSAGIGVVFGPTGGYFIGFVLAVFVMSYLRGKNVSLKKYLFLTILIGMPIIYFCGVSWMSLYNGISIIKTIKIAVFPFFLGDVMKAFIASTIAVKINKIR